MEKYKISGMSCAACASRIEKAVENVDGIESCSVNLMAASLTVEGNANEKAITEAVTKAGYGITPESEYKEDGGDVKLLKNRLILSVVLLVPLMYFSMGHMVGLPLPVHMTTGIIQLVLCTVIMIVNKKFFVSGFHKSMNMDTLVALGSSVSYIYSVVLLIAHGGAEHMYFDSAAMILTLITVGKLLEALTKGRTFDAVKKLMELRPQAANLVKDGEIEVIPISELKKGDIFAVKAGESIPSDGIVVKGSGSVDESSLTGESIPVEKEEGSRVYEASVNRMGYMECEAEEVGTDTFMARIIEMVTDAAGTKAPVSRTADRVAAIFVPVVICIAIITFIIWLVSGAEFGFAISRGVSVLVISCPCALGLATPAAVMAGNGRGAAKGILFRNAQALEELGKTDTLVLDKTGTITEGKHKVSHIIPQNGFSEEEFIFMAASAERNSEHPLAAAIIEAAGDKKLAEVDNFKVHPGSGISCIYEGNVIYGGSFRYMDNIIELTDEMRETERRLGEMGETALVFSYDGKPMGIVGLKDKVRESTVEAIARLDNMGINTVMLTGDSKAAAKVAAKEAGIKYVIAEVMPDMKAKVVNALKKAGKVAMAGDGINDAPALMTADVGMAVGTGTDIAVGSADVVLMQSRPSDMAGAISLSRKTLRDIRQNLFWAFIYNVICIPLAAGALAGAGILLNPMMCAGAMSVSSICVVLNALRLNYVDIYDVSKDKKKEKVNIEMIIEEINSKEETEVMKKTMTVKGMMCMHCEANVKKALESIEGVTNAVADHEHDKVEIITEKDVKDEDLMNAVKEAGYEPESVVY